MTAKIIGGLSGLLCVMTCTGFDCPTCNVGWQIAATIVLGIVAFVCLFSIDE